MHQTVSKANVIARIKQYAAENGGLPPGLKQFEKASGIKKYDWYPHHWLRWSDAQKDAGFNSNPFTQRISDELVWEKFAVFVRQLGRFPVDGELRLKKKSDGTFPSTKTLRDRGNQRTWALQIMQWCKSKSEFDDVISICQSVLDLPVRSDSIDHHRQSVRSGYVYMMKIGSNYKVGMSDSVERRARQLAIVQVDDPRIIWKIKTDDPTGIEKYWHRRFAEKKVPDREELFKLAPEDVAAFKRWKRIW